MENPKNISEEEYTEVELLEKKMYRIILEILELDDEKDSLESLKLNIHKLYLRGMLNDKLEVEKRVIQKGFIRGGVKKDYRLKVKKLFLETYHKYMECEKKTKILYEILKKYDEDH